MIGLERIFGKNKLSHPRVDISRYLIDHSNKTSMTKKEWAELESKEIQNKMDYFIEFELNNTLSRRNFLENITPYIPVVMIYIQNLFK